MPCVPFTLVLLLLPGKGMSPPVPGGAFTCGLLLPSFPPSLPLTWDAVFLRPLCRPRAKRA
jgi:hypothetical protein